MSEHTNHDPSQIQLPAPTFWPMVLAFGITLLLAGLVTHWAVSVVGVLIAGKAVTGWWKTVIPHELHESVTIEAEHRPTPVRVGARSVVRLKLGEGGHRVRVPEEIHPYSAGFWGGLAGGAVMAILAALYGLIAFHSVWYPINLLAGVVIPDMGSESVKQLSHFTRCLSSRRWSATVPSQSWSASSTLSCCRCSQNMPCFGQASGCRSSGVAWWPPRSTSSIPPSTRASVGRGLLSAN